MSKKQEPSQTLESCEGQVDAAASPEAAAKRVSKKR